MLRRFLLPVLAVAALATATLPSLAAYPEKPIRLIVPSAPGMPKDVVARLNAEIRTALASQAVRDRFKALGAETSPSTPEEFLELSRQETTK